MKARKCERTEPNWTIHYPKKSFPFDTFFPRPTNMEMIGKNKKMNRDAEPINLGNQL